jgi:hypothetical protein
MKKILPFILILVGFTACEFYYVEPAYDSRSRIVGSYDAEEYSETYNDYVNYSIYIERGYQSNEIYIRNFYGVEISIKAYVDYDRITIYRQVVNGYEIEGAGTIYGNSISFHYHVKDLVTNSRTDYCELTAWR